MVINGITFKEYTTLFYKGLPEGFHYQKTPVQLYDLKQISAFLKTPTTLMRAEFSFLVHLTSGHFEQQVGNEIKKVKAGSVLLAGHGQVTSLLKVSPDIQGSFILFENSTLNEFLTRKELLKLFVINPLIHLPQQDNLWIIKLNHLLYEEVNLTTPNPDVCTAILYTILHKVLSSSEIGKGYETSFDIAIKFRELAYRNFTAHNSIKWYAGELNVSENNLYRFIKKVLGKSPKEFLIEIAVVESQLLLKDFTKTIAEVAYELNFEDPSYFARVFKKIFGYTPSDYRKCLLQDLS